MKNEKKRKKKQDGGIVLILARQKILVELNVLISKYMTLQCSTLSLRMWLRCGAARTQLVSPGRGLRRSPAASPPATRGITEPESLVAALDRAIAFRLSATHFKFDFSILLFKFRLAVFVKC